MNLHNDLRISFVLLMIVFLKQLVHFKSINYQMVGRFKTRAGFRFGNLIKLHLLPYKVSPSHSHVNSFNAKADLGCSIKVTIFIIGLSAI